MVLSKYDSRSSHSRFHVVSASLSVQRVHSRSAHISKRFGFRVKKFVPFQSVGAEHWTNLLCFLLLRLLFPNLFLACFLLLAFHEEVAEVENSEAYMACLSAVGHHTGCNWLTEWKIVNAHIICSMHSVRPQCDSMTGKNRIWQRLLNFDILFSSPSTKWQFN